MFTITPGGRTTAAGVRFQLGLVTFNFDLMTVFGKGEDEEAAKMRLACPDPSHGGHGVAVAQRYLCANDAGHGPYEQSECLRRTDGEDSVIIDADKVKALKLGGMATKVCELHVHPADEVLAACRFGPKAYMVRPVLTANTVTEPEERAYSLLYHYVLEHPKVVLMGELALAQSRATYIFTVHRGALLLQEVVIPANQRPGDEVELAAPDAGLYEQLETLLAGQTEPFDEALYDWSVSEALEMLKAEARAAVTTEAPPAPMFTAENIDEAVAAALAAAQKAAVSA